MNDRVEEVRKLSRENRFGTAFENDVGQIQPTSVATDRMVCPVCDEDISVRAKKCRHCGETLDVTMRMAEEARRASERGGNVYMNAANAPSEPSKTVDYTRTKSKVVAFLLAWILGGIGGHKFYLDRVGQGILYLIFCWTFIPLVISFIEGIVYITMDDERFWQKYG